MGKIPDSVWEIPVPRMPTLKELRGRQFLSQVDLAKKAGVTESTINRLEGSKQKPTFKTIRKLAKALGVEPGEIEFHSR